MSARLTGRPRKELQARRRYVGLTQETLAWAIGATPTSVAGWEQGRCHPTVRFRQPLAEALQVTLPELDRLLDPEAPLVLDGHRVPAWLDHYTSLEQAAAILRAFELVVVHALLQTKAYAFSVARASYLPLTDEQVSERVGVRMARQAVLERQPEPLDLAVVLAEPALREVVGGRDVMAGQLDHLLKVAGRSNVDLRVLPADGRVACAAFGSFKILTKPGAVDPFMVCAEDLTGFRYHESPHAVEMHLALFEHLQSIALSPAQSIDLIRTTKESHYP